MATKADQDQQHKIQSTRYAWRNLKVQNRASVAKWRTFEGFLEDMGIRPDGMVLVVRDRDKPWSKSNCYWGARYKAGVIHARARKITWKGITTSAADWGRQLNIKPGTIVSRLYRG
ncbi:MAG: hypothetical protein ACLGSH_11160 [Acidobacteriota bacterium]